MINQSDFHYFSNLNLSISNIFAFIAVMNTGGLLSASYYLNCSQPAVSISLKKFSSSFPFKLFTREGRRLMPTPHAFHLYERLTPLMLEMKKVMECSYMDTPDVSDRHTGRSFSQ